MEKNTEYRLSDDAISQIAKLLQVAILTGTDVVDNLRTVRLESTVKGNYLTPTLKYTEQFDENLQRLLEDANELVGATDDE